MISKNVATAVANLHAEEPASTGKALRERLKETTSLYESRRRMGPELPLEDICRQIFDHLIPAMHFPAMASAISNSTAGASRQRTIARVIRTNCKRTL